MSVSFLSLKLYINDSKINKKYGKINNQVLITVNY